LTKAFLSFVIMSAELIQWHYDRDSVVSGGSMVLAGPQGTLRNMD